LILGNGKIIGGTANTLEDVLMRANEKCDYIGLGPFRFTTTKEKLSPVLGLTGFEKITSELSNRKINIPVYAIGGILLEDIGEILETGIFGMAVSGALTEQFDKRKWIGNFNLKINEKTDYCRQGV
jgi:thiamine-phosphate pyrophosphorylase